MKKRILIPLAAAAVVSSAFVAKVMLKGVDVASMDKKAEPQHDFYQFANGTWCQNNPVPAAEPRWTSFNILADKNNETLRNILTDAARDMKSAPGSIRQKVGAFYRAAMDTVKLEKEGVEPLAETFHRIDMMQGKEELMGLLAEFHKKGIPSFFSFNVGQDIKKSDQYICYFAQGGLGLPDRDYYFKDDEKSKKIREAYQAYIRDLFMACNQMADAPASADVIMRMETQLASASMTRVERRDREKQYNKRTIAELAESTKALNWESYFAGTGLGTKQLKDVIVSQPAFFTALNSLVEKENLQDIKIYLRWKVMNASTSYLSQNVSTLSFGFYGKTLTGTKEQKPRWKRVVASANSLIGELLAQEYVKTAFSPESKQRVNEMVDNLRAAFKVRIEKLDWMSPETKVKALEKLQAFNRKLGYPDKWKDYSALTVQDDSYLQNAHRAAQFDFADNVNKLGKPIDRAEWNMLPQTVNAYYSAVMNEIVFPAAIMQPPFFDAAADDAVNYGAIGAVIGHEFSHGFDDQGSKYDAQGNLNEWWTAEDRARFVAKTKVLVQQYNTFQVEESVKVNGELTLGENIADFAGLTLAYDAYQMSLKNKKRVTIDGFTPEQRFFIGFAQVWKNNATPEFLRQQVITDPHSPGRFRVMGPLSNMPAFYAAFAVKPGDRMYRGDTLRAPDLVMTKIPPFRDIIILEDDELIFINKPPHVSSLDERDGNALSILKLAKKYHADAQLCHRLDKETSGVLVIAKNPDAYREMAMSFEARKVDKTYHAVVEGVLNVQSKSIHLPLGITKKGIAKVDMKEGKPAETVVDTLKMFHHFTLLACKPVTGRLHQIRIHLASQNFPIVSDLTYGGHLPMLSRYKKDFRHSKLEAEQSIMKRVALHAYSLRLTLKEKEYFVEAPYPKDFEVFLKLIEKFGA